MNNIPCRYFQSPTGCRFGDNCRFSHSIRNTTNYTPYTQYSNNYTNNYSNTSNNSKSIACKFYASAGGCRYGDRCYYKHIADDNNSINKQQTDKQMNDEANPKADLTDEIIVSGFIRELMAMVLSENTEAQKELQIINDLLKICVSFYSIIIKWDVNMHNHNMRVINNGNCIQMCNGNNWGSALLTEVYSHGMHHWKFNIASLDSRRQYYVLFGLWKTNSDSKPILNSFFTDKKNNGYAMNVIDGTLTNPLTPGCGGAKYATYCKQGDIIDMYCDFNNLQLTFAINGKYYANGQKIEKTTYKVAVTMYWEKDTIRFIAHDNKPFKQ